MIFSNINNQKLSFTENLRDKAKYLGRDKETQQIGGQDYSFTQTFPEFLYMAAIMLAHSLCSKNSHHSGRTYKHIIKIQ